MTQKGTNTEYPSQNYRTLRLQQTRWTASDLRERVTGPDAGTFPPEELDRPAQTC